MSERAGDKRGEAKSLANQIERVKCLIASSESGEGALNERELQLIVEALRSFASSSIVPPPGWLAELDDLKYAADCPSGGSEDHRTYWEALENAHRRGWFGVAGGEPIAPSAIAPFTLEVCEELFGCHLATHYGAEQGDFSCAICEKAIDISKWVHAEHEADCIIVRVRDYLAKHKPEVVRSRGVDWMRATDGGAKT